MRKVVALAATEKGRLLLVRKDETWILPGGKPRENEEDIPCLERELWEEIPGTRLQGFMPLGVWFGKAPHTGDTIACWVYAGGVKAFKPLTPGHEISEVRWVSPTEISDLNLSEVTQQVVTTLRFTDLF